MTDSPDSSVIEEVSDLVADAPQLNPRHIIYADKLSKEERMLVQLRDEMPLWFTDDVIEKLVRSGFPDLATIDVTSLDATPIAQKWDFFVTYLTARSNPKSNAFAPYIFKIAVRCEADIPRVAKLRAYEREHGIDLADYI